MSPMTSKRDFYEVLGVHQQVGEQEIASAYRKLAIKFHPDSNPDQESTERFKEAAEAFEVLSDPEKRARYDQFGHAGLEGAGYAPHFQDVSDIFEAFGDIFGGGVFGDLFGGGRRGQRARRGADIKCQVTLDLEEAARGVSKTIRFDRRRKCRACDGTGGEPGSTVESCARCGGQGQVVQRAGILHVQTTCPSCQGAGKRITVPCSTCRGSGHETEPVTLDVAIPSGVDDGMRVRLSGEGEPSPGGGSPGDCYCFIKVREHSLFQRDGQHIILQCPITYSQAVLGATVEVPTLDGRDDLKIPPGTQLGEVFRLRGCGLPDFRGGGKGDLLVQVMVEVPHKVSGRQKELLRELAELENADVTPQRKSFLKKLGEYFVANESGDGQAEE